MNCFLGSLGTERRSSNSEATPHNDKKKGRKFRSGLSTIFPILIVFVMAVSTPQKIESKAFSNDHYSYKSEKSESLIFFHTYYSSYNFCYWNNKPYPKTERHYSNLEYQEFMSQSEARARRSYGRKLSTTMIMMRASFTDIDPESKRSPLPLCLPGRSNLLKLEGRKKRIMKYIRMFGTSSSDSDLDSDSDAKSLEAKTRFDDLLDKDRDPQYRSTLIYLIFATILCLGLGIVTYQQGGSLLGIGFDSETIETVTSEGTIIKSTPNLYWGGAPTWALLITYIPVLFLFPNFSPLLLGTFSISALLSCLQYFYPYQQIGWEATEQNAVITTTMPVLFYITFFVIRAQNTYKEIQEEEEQQQEEQKNRK